MAEEQALLSAGPGPLTRLVGCKKDQSLGTSAPRAPAECSELPLLQQLGLLFFFFLSFVFVVVVVAISWAAPAAYGGSQSRGRIGAVATCLHHSHSNAGSDLRLQPTPQLMATPDQ